MLKAAVVDAIDDAVRTELERSKQPGLVLGLTDRERTLVVRCYGYADLASHRAVIPETLFEIGSIGKSFTALAVLQLVDEGRIDLQAPVDRYLPWFAARQPAGHVPITVAHLLSHSAGIVAGIDGTPEAAFQVWSLRDLQTYSRPGERFHYSNVGYKALGLVLEAVDARPYREILRARILDPLGMTATEPSITHEVRSRLAVGYEYLHDDRIGYPGAPLAPATWLETETADGSIASTAEDMCAFARLLLRGGESATGRLVSERAFEQMSTAHARMEETLWYGYGLIIRELDGRRLIGHGGGMVGYLAGLQVEPDVGVGAVVLQNGVSANPMAIARNALRIARDELETAPLGAVHATSATQDVLGDLAGVYAADEPTRDTLELVSEPHGPVLRTGEREIVLTRLDDTRFLAPDAAFARFAITAEHRYAELWHGDARYTRAGVQPRPLRDPPPELVAISGHYRSHNPWTTNFRVILRGDQPWLVFSAAPDGFNDEQLLVAADDGSFRVGTDAANPEVLRFDTVPEGRALRAWLSGWPYYRVG